MYSISVRISAVRDDPFLRLIRLPVEVPVYDWPSEVVQVLHALGHVDGDHQLGLQVDQPAP